jgi:3D (Asp-Asp-Asp) domain-containing protein
LYPIITFEKSSKKYEEKQSEMIVAQQGLISSLKTTIDLLEQEVESLEGLNDEILNRKVIESLSTYKVEEYELTAYCPCEICCGKYSDGITYSGTHATYGRTIAVDPKVIPIGSTVYIDGIGIRIAEDIGGAIDGKHIDIYFDNHEDALDFGVQNANVIILEKGRKQ